MVRFIIYQKCPFKRQLSLAGYAQSSVPWELRLVVDILESRNFGWSIQTFSFLKHSSIAFHSGPNQPYWFNRWWTLLPLERYQKMKLIGLKYCKRGRVFPMVIWPAFRMGQYSANDHPYHAPQFTIFDTWLIFQIERNDFLFLGYKTFSYYFAKLRHYL